MVWLSLSNLLSRLVSLGARRWVDGISASTLGAVVSLSLVSWHFAEKEYTIFSTKKKIPNHPIVFTFLPWHLFSITTARFVFRHIISGFEGFIKKTRPYPADGWYSFWEMQRHLERKGKSLSIFASCRVGDPMHSKYPVSPTCGKKTPCDSGICHSLRLIWKLEKVFTRQPSVGRDVCWCVWTYLVSDKQN